MSPTTDDWEARLESIYETMREMSLQTEPQAMVEAYARRMAQLIPVDRRISLSRRGLSQPQFRVTRFSEWQERINPWKQAHRLPLLSGGLFSELIYSDRPQIIDALQVAADDPAAPYLEGQQSLMAIPMLDGGESINMVIATRREPGAFERERFPEYVWMSNLFGRATHNLVLKQDVAEAYSLVDREMRVVAEIQKSLLPAELPRIKDLQLATYYRTSHRAGGDYYDFFPLADDKWGLLIADVSGHGTPAAVMMAITHSIAHLSPKESGRPGDLLEFVNEHLTRRYTADAGTFVTAFYGIFDPAAHRLTYSSAGHNPPRLWKHAQREPRALNEAGSLPLGVHPGVHYPDASVTLEPTDRLVMYTDGITEAHGSTGELFGTERVDSILRMACRQPPQSIVDTLVQEVDRFTGGADPTDDRTLVVAKVE